MPTVHSVPLTPLKRLLSEILDEESSDEEDRPFDDELEFLILVSLVFPALLKEDPIPYQ